MKPGDRIRAGCAALGISQTELAKRVGLSPQNLQRILDGSVEKSRHLKNIADKISATVQWLKTGTGIPPEWYVASDDGPTIYDQSIIIPNGASDSDLRQIISRNEIEKQALVNEISRLRRELSALKSGPRVLEVSEKDARARALHREEDAESERLLAETESARRRASPQPRRKGGRNPPAS